MSHTSSPDHGISDAHWAIIENAPVAAFLLVAGANGRVDRKELKVFARRVTAAFVSGEESPIMTSAVQRISDGLEDRLAELSGKSAEELARLVTMSRRAICQDAGEPAADAFARSLFAVAYQVARASGGLLSLSSKIDSNEKMALDGLKRALKLA
jgi:hypothetical protein